MNIIIPMAGQGQRFADNGFRVPKPLINVAGIPMYRHALNGMPLSLATRLVFLVRSNDFYDQLVADIQAHYAPLHNCYIEKLERNTQGQAETVLKSGRLLDLDQPTLVHNCDSYVTSLMWEEMLKKDVEGAMVVFRSQEPRWSYAKLNEKRTKIIEVREKQVISPYASTGTYFFKDTRLLLKNIQTLIDHNWRENNEYYLSTIYQLMLKDHKLIIPLWASRFLCFGTPKDLVDSLNTLILYQKGNSHFS